MRLFAEKNKAWHERSDRSDPPIRVCVPPDPVRRGLQAGTTATTAG